MFVVVVIICILTVRPIDSSRFLLGLPLFLASRWVSHCRDSSICYFLSIPTSPSISIRIRRLEELIPYLILLFLKRHPCRYATSLVLLFLRSHFCSVGVTFLMIPNDL